MLGTVHIGACFFLHFLLRKGKFQTLRMIPGFLLTSNWSGIVDQQQRGLTDVRVVPKPIGLHNYAAFLDEAASW
jgi:hypothetical protein